MAEGLEIQGFKKLQGKEVQLIKVENNSSVDAIIKNMGCISGFFQGIRKWEQIASHFGVPFHGWSENKYRYGVLGRCYLHKKLLPV